MGRKIGIFSLACKNNILITEKECSEAWCTLYENEFNLNVKKISFTNTYVGGMGTKTPFEKQASEMANSL